MTPATIYILALTITCGGLGLIYWLEGLLYKRSDKSNFNRDYK